MKRTKQIIYLIEAAIKMSSINNNVTIEMANDCECGGRGPGSECKHISISVGLIYSIPFDIIFIGYFQWFRVSSQVIVPISRKTTNYFQTIKCIAAKHKRKQARSRQENCVAEGGKSQRKNWKIFCIKLFVHIFIIVNINFPSIVSLFFRFRSLLRVVSQAPRLPPCPPQHRPHVVSKHCKRISDERNDNFIGQEVDYELDDAHGIRPATSIDLCATFNFNRLSQWLNVNMKHPLHY